MQRILPEIDVHGNTDWDPHFLCPCAVLFCLAQGDSWRQKYLQLQFLVGDLSCEGFLKALTKRKDFIFSLRSQFQAESRAVAQSLGVWEVSGRVPLAVDGTKLELPRTAKNQQAFCAAGKSSHQSESDAKKKDNPQLMVTNIWHVLSGVPWDFRWGRSGASERELMLEMLSDLPENTVLLADAGYTGYDFLNAILNTSFIIRAGGNVNLIQGLEVDDDGETVYVWPQEKQNAGAPPLKLRLIVFQLKKETIHLVTNMMDITADEAKELYLARWGVEVHHRDFKDAFFPGRRLRARSQKRVEMEIIWSFTSYWTTRLLAAQADLETASESTATRPKRKARTKSFSQLQKLINAAVQGQVVAHTSLAEALANAVVDSYQRKKPKASRDYPRKKKHKPTLPPKIRAATEKERKTHEKIKQELHLAI
jgi:hypothetical protein